MSLSIPEFDAASSGIEILNGGGISGDNTDNQFDFSGFTVVPIGNFFGIVGLGGNDILIGSSVSDSIDGGDGDDVLTGGLGKDWLFGEAGSDRFVYTSVQDSLPGKSSHDIIFDFSHSQGDLIDLSQIDADTTQDGNQAFHLGGSAFTDTPGELIQFIDSHGHTILEGDVNGDGVADFEIQLNRGPILVSGDFVM